MLHGPEFYKPAHEMIFDAIVEVYNRSQPADALLVGDELAKRGELKLIGGAPYLADLMAQVPTAANAGYYARIVKEKSLMRGLVQAGTRITQLGYSTNAGDIDKLVTITEAEVSSWAILYLSLARWSSANYTAIVFHSPNDLDQSNRTE